ncbi:MAG: DCC1-like thiol-disulfide oxidoreductase family protein [Cytophagaceae bacterium]
MNNSTIILFDGVCNLCSGSVQFILKRDKKGVFKFASLQSDIGSSYLSQFEISGVDSIVCIQDEKAFTKFKAVQRISKELGRGYKFLYWISKIIPVTLGNLLYDFIAKNRYRWMGKKEVCWIPSPEWKERFLK